MRVTTGEGSRVGHDRDFHRLPGVICTFGCVSLYVLVQTSGALCFVLSLTIRRRVCAVIGAVLFSFPLKSSALGCHSHEPVV